MPGGRPRNDWKVSRERKLVRLYVLSRLDLVEIQRVIEDEGFNPSLRDVQKRLNALLPKDYAKDYRKYRPSSHGNAEQRFFHIKYCVDDRVRKYRKPGPQGRGGLSNSIDLTKCENSADLLAGPVDHVQNSTATANSPPEQYIDPQWLQYPVSGAVWNACIVSAPVPRLFPSTNSGSILGPSTDSVALSGAQPGTWDAYEFIGNDFAAFEVARIGYGNEPGAEFRDGSILHNQNFDSKLQIPHTHSSFMQHHTIDSTHENDSSPGSVTIHSLRRRLPEKYSRPSLEHVKSILQYSSASSEKSSWASKKSSRTSTVSSGISRSSVTSSRQQQTESYLEKIAAIAAPKRPVSLLKNAKARLNEGEKSVWKDLVDESQLGPPATAVPFCPQISLFIRPCCGMVGTTTCEECGISKTHLQTIKWAKSNTAAMSFRGGDPEPYIDDKDHFGNISLHFAAASRSLGLLHMIKWLLAEGVDIGVRNTSGETFMHVLHSSHFRVIEDFIELLQLLAKQKFPLLISDYHGQRLADMFFAIIDPRDIPFEQLTIIVSHLRPDSYDLRACYLSYCLEHLEKVGSLEKLIAPCREPIQSFALLSNASYWSKFLDGAHLARDIDSQGDSALVHIVKDWGERDDERLLANIIENLVKLGADVDMRDRNGYTALAIAARKGLRPAVRVLLNHGANPNARSYNGTGILCQVSRELLRAKKDKIAKRYAMILSCMTLLIDNEAKDKPTAYDEWQLRDIPRSYTPIDEGFMRGFEFHGQPILQAIFRDWGLRTPIANALERAGLGGHQSLPNHFATGGCDEGLSR